MPSAATTDLDMAFEVLDQAERFVAKIEGPEDYALAPAIATARGEFRREIERLREELGRARSAMPCFCGTADAYRCPTQHQPRPAHVRRSMNIVPLTLKQANALVAEWHRHHKPVHAHRFSIGAMKSGRVVGAAIVARPVAHATPQYEVAEVVRLVTDGTKNAPSALYAAAARAAQAMGFWKIQTFILEHEPGTSLLAAGWEFDGWTDGGDWNRPSRGGRRTDQPQGRKQRWKKILNRRLEDAEMLVMSA